MEGQPQAVLGVMELFCIPTGGSYMSSYRC